MDLKELRNLARGAAAQRPGSRDGAGPAESDPGAAEALRRAMAYLARRPRTERQVRDKLAEAGHDRVAVETAVGRLSELGLVDDDAFSRAWIEERSRTRGKAPEILVSELVARGVAREVAEQALADVGPDEEAQAVEVAQKLHRKVARFALRDQALKLHQMLARRGFSEEASEKGIRAVLPPEGWD